MCFPSPSLFLTLPPCLGSKRDSLVSSYLFLSFLISFFIYCLSPFSRAAPVACGSSQARGLIRATAAGLHHSHSHSHARSEPHLRPTPQLTATTDPSPSERGQGSKPRPVLFLKHKMPCGCGCGVGQWLQLPLDPHLGTSIGRWCGPQKTKKKQKSADMPQGSL